MWWYTACYLLAMEANPTRCVLQVCFQKMFYTTWSEVYRHPNITPICYNCIWAWICCYNNIHSAGFSRFWILAAEICSDVGWRRLARSSQRWRMGLRSVSLFHTKLGDYFFMHLALCTVALPCWNRKRYFPQTEAAPTVRKSISKSLSSSY